jgi:putative membrane protein
MRALVIVATAALVTPAAAQFGNPGFVMPGTTQSAPGVPAPNQTNTQDRLFALLVAAGGAAEVDFGRLAEGKAQNEAVKEFARRMVQDHTKANGELTNLANAAQIPLPGELDPDHKDMRAKLETAAGAVFDLTYMQGQVVDHQKTVILLQWEIGQGQDAPMQQWAAATLPVVLAHLEMAKNLLAELAAQAPQASISSPAAPVPQAAPQAAPVLRERPAQKK